MVWAGSGSKHGSDVENTGNSVVECSVRMRQLKRTGLSKFYASKSQSFSSLELALSSAFGDSAAALSKRPSSLSLDLERANSGTRGCSSGASNDSSHSGRAFSSECGGSSPQSSNHTDTSCSHDWLPTHQQPSTSPRSFHHHQLAHSANQSFRHPAPGLPHSQSLNSNNPTCQGFSPDLYALHGCYDSVCEATEDICAAMASLLPCGSTSGSERSSYARTLSYHSSTMVVLPCMLEHCEMVGDD